MMGPIRLLLIATHRSWAGSAHAPISSHIQPIGLSVPRARRRGERLDGRQGVPTAVVTAHGKQLPVEHRETKPAGQQEEVAR